MATSTGSAKGPLEKRYAKLETKRQQFTAAAEAAAELTIPSIFPRESDRRQARSSGTKIVLQAPWQNTGSRGVNNLAAKLLLTLLPPNSPFFRFQLEDALQDEIGTDAELKGLVEAALQKMERQVMEEVESNSMRVDTFEGLRHLIVAGNYLLFVPNEGAMKGWDLSQYVVRRDHRGTVLEIIIREAVDRKSADPRVRAIIENQSTTSARGKDEAVFLFTKIELSADGRRYETMQEVCGQMVPGTKGSWRRDALPFMALRFRKIEGEDYGRGLVEENIGDLKTLETLTRALTEGAAAASRVLWGVKPGAPTNARILAQKKNGDFFQANEGDVFALQLNKGADFQVAFQKSERIEESLAFIFLLNSAIQRNGERVTAEEIRFMAGELEDTLGGVYSILSQEFQRPLVTRLIQRMQRAGRLPTFRDEDLKTVIVTGIEAIGRGQDITRLRGFAEDVKVLAEINPGILQFVNERQMLINIATARGIEVSEFIRSEEEVAEIQQQAQQAALAQQAGQAGVQGLGKGAEQLAANLANNATAVPEEGAEQ